MGDFKQLKVWQRAHELAVLIYDVTAEFPPAELDGLTSQLRRAAASVTSNIAESCGRNTSRDQVHFFRIAQGSAREVESQLLLVRDIRYLDGPVVDRALCLIDEVQRMLSALIRVNNEAAARQRLR